MNPYLKLLVSQSLQWIPGGIGEKFETRALWAQRQLRARSSGDEFEQELGRLTKDSICIDLGANVGEITAQMAAVAGHVHAFEPGQWAFNQLKAKVGHLNNVTLYNAAIGVDDGTMTLYEDPGLADRPEVYSQGTSAFRSVLWQDGQPKGFEVEVKGLSGFLRSLQRSVDLLKVDIEGAEVALINALLDSPEAGLVKVMFVETHECQIPELRPSTKLLRNRLASTTQPKTYLEWH